MASKTILVIDADSETEQLIASTLESEGYLVFAVPGGDIGTEMAQKVSPSLIFINPEETGLEMCKTIRGFESLQKVPLVLLTSPIGGIDPAAGAAFGVADVLEVPFTAAELLEKTAKVLDTKAPIVLRVKEKDLVPASEEGAFPDFLEGPVAQQNSGIESKVPQVSGITEFDEEPDAGSVFRKEKGLEPTDTYISGEASRRRKRRNNLPVVVAGVVIVIVGIAAGALFYLGLIPGMETKKAVSVKPLSTAVKPNGQSPAPAPSPTPSNEQQKQQAVAENITAPAPSSSAGTAAPTASSPISSTPVKKEPSPSSSAEEPAPSATVKPSGKAVYSVQLGVFRSEGNATALTKEFKEKGYDAFMVKSTGKDSGTLYRVLVGKSADRKESSKLAAKIRDKEKIRAVIFSE
jgi:cell division septation protein DedD